ncbi:hypothetical protein J6590_095128 [Homalodisca vitripennis]|nr:hypothetical protein J6590_095128 [Homalodisca vitripennis]
MDTDAPTQFALDTDVPKLKSHGDPKKINNDSGALVPGYKYCSLEADVRVESDGGTSKTAASLRLTDLFSPPVPRDVTPTPSTDPEKV